LVAAGQLLGGLGFVDKVDQVGGEFQSLVAEIVPGLSDPVDQESGVRRIQEFLGGYRGLPGGRAEAERNTAQILCGCQLPVSFEGRCCSILRRVGIAITESASDDPAGHRGTRLHDSG
jgi:hypothetical protein